MSAICNSRIKAAGVSPELTLTVWCDPTGFAARRIFLQEIEERIRQNPRKCSLLYLAPSEPAVRNIHFSLARNLGAAMSFKVFTIRQLKNLLSRTARDIPRPASRMVRTVVAAESYKKSLSGGFLTSAARVLPPPGLIRYLMQLFSDIYRSGLGRRFDCSREEQELKNRIGHDMTSLFHTYETALASQGFIDPEALYYRLAQELQLSQPLSPVIEEIDHVLLENPADLTAPELFFLTALLTRVSNLWVSLPLDHPPGEKQSNHPIHIQARSFIQHLANQYLKAERIVWKTTGIPPTVSRSRLALAMRATSSLGKIMNPAPAACAESSKDLSDGEILIVKGRTPFEEVERIATIIKTILNVEDDVVPGDCIVIVPSSSEHGSLLRSSFLKQGIPIHQSETQSLAETRPVEMLIRLIRMRLSGYRRDDVLALTRYLPEEITGSIGRFEQEVRLAGVMGNVSAGRQINWGREWIRPLEDHRKHLATCLKELARSGNDTTTAEHDREQKRLTARIEAVEKGISVLCKVFSLAGRLRDKMSPGAFSTALRSIVESEVMGIVPSKSSERTGYDDLLDLPLHLTSRNLVAPDILCDLLDKIKNSFHHTQDAAIDLAILYMSFWEGCLETRISLPSRPGAVQVYRLGEHHGLCARHVFLTGLTSNNFPPLQKSSLPAANGFPGFPAGETEKRRLWNEARKTIVWALCAGSRSVVLSYSASSESGTLPSLLVDGLEALLAPHQVQEITKAVHTSSSTRGKQCLLALGKNLSHHPGTVSLDISGATAGGWEDARRTLYRKLLVCRDRNNAWFGSYDGLIGPDLHHDQIGFGADHRFSASQLEDLARCPFHFFAARVLGLEPEIEEDEEITPLTRGAIIHEILSRFYMFRLQQAGLIDDGKRHPDLGDMFWSSKESIRVRNENLPEAQRQLREITHQILQQQALIQPGPFWERELENLVKGLEEDVFFPDLPNGGTAVKPGVLKCFLIDECRQPETAVPAFFEAGFTINLAVSTDGKPVIFKGRIDRIDVAQDGSYIVLDYKTGKPPAIRDIESGHRFQVPIYVKGAQHILDGTAGGKGFKPVGAGYMRLKPALPGNNRRTGFLSIEEGSGKDRKHHVVKEARSGLKSPEEFHRTITAGLRYAMMATDKIRAGGFHTTIDEGEGAGALPSFCTRNCLFRTMCRVDVTRRRRTIDYLRHHGIDIPVNPNLVTVETEAEKDGKDIVR